MTAEQQTAKYDHCVRELITQYPTLTLCVDACPGVHIVPVVLTEDCTTIPENVGRLEYQVSDGPPGKRSHSIDVYTLEEALVAARELTHT